MMLLILVTVFAVMTVSMSTLALANTERILHRDGGQKCTKSDAEATEHKCGQARAVSAECLLFIAPGLVPTSAKVSIVLIGRGKKLKLDHLPQPWIIQALSGKRLFHLKQLRYILHLIN